MGRIDAGRRYSIAGRRAVVLGLAVVAVVVLASFGQLHDWLVAFLPIAEVLIKEQPFLGAAVFVLFSALSAMLAFVSSAVIVPVAVYVWGTAVSALLLMLGWVLGGVCAYSLSRYLGRPVVRALVPKSTVGASAERLSRSTPFGFVLLFQLAMPSEVPGYVLGLVRYDFRKYLAALVLAELPYAVATIYIAAGFVERRIFMIAAAGAGVVAFSVWALVTLQRRIQDVRSRPQANDAP